MDDIRKKGCVSEPSVPKLDVLSLQRQITDCKIKKRILYEQMNDGKIGRDAYLAEKESLNKAEQEVERQMAENTNQETATTEKDARFSPELLSRLIYRIDVVSEKEIRITYKSEVSQ